MKTRNKEKESTVVELTEPKTTTTDSLEQQLKKRKTLHTVLGSTLVGTAMLSSERWVKPVMNAVIIPAHAQTTTPEIPETATLEIMNADGGVVPNDSDVNIGEIITVSFTISPNPGAGASYPVTVSLNGVETSASNPTTDASGTLSITGTAGEGAVSGDIQTVCLELNGDPEYLCATLNLFHPASDINIKENIERVDHQAVLSQLIDTPISYWNYRKDSDSIRHIGPMAQDFSGAFEVGDSDKHIHIIDGQGVALASIQALHELVEAQNEQIELLKQQLAKLQTIPHA